MFLFIYSFYYLFFSLEWKLHEGEILSFLFSDVVLAHTTELSNCPSPCLDYKLQVGREFV